MLAGADARSRTQLCVATSFGVTRDVAGELAPHALDLGERPRDLEGEERVAFALAEHAHRIDFAAHGPSEPLGSLAIERRDPDLSRASLAGPRADHAQRRRVVAKLAGARGAREEHALALARAS